jgi:prepilin-type N-terminal cleavage/methylation domain-containing protein
MQTRISDFRLGGSTARRAFSLIELLTAVSIMLVIIYALYAMFNQTQKALRANITQVDVLESGRAAAEMLGRELEQMSASDLAQTINLYAGMTPVPPLAQYDVDQSTAVPPLRTNILQEFFFLTRQTNQWYGIGYRVMGAESGVGTLYRFTAATNSYRLNATNMMGRFMHAMLTTNRVTGQLSTNFNRVADGVIHLRLTAYDPDGRRMDYSSTNMHPSYRILRLDRSGGRLGLLSTANNGVDATVILRPDPFDGSRRETQFAFISNAVPGYVELELGVLEPSALKQYESLRDAPKTAAAFLKKQAAKVHLFRQRIPIRTALQ